VVYQMSAAYEPDAQGGLRYDDPLLGFDWPLAVTTVSSRDREWPPLETLEPELRRRMSI
jgi:dTDP-4-dehydrorhamnose 3,5-epimerase